MGGTNESERAASKGGIVKQGKDVQRYDLEPKRLPASDLFNVGLPPLQRKKPTTENIDTDLISLFAPDVDFYLIRMPKTSPRQPPLGTQFQIFLNFSSV